VLYLPPAHPRPARGRPGVGGCGDFSIKTNYLNKKQFSLFFILIKIYIKQLF